MIIQEQELDRLVRCPLMVSEPSKNETCAAALTSWVLLQSFNNKFDMSGSSQDLLHKIRGKMLELWADNTGDEELDWEMSVGTLARTSAFRLFSLVMEYEVVHLEHPYNLILGGYTIQGRYALLRKRVGKALHYVLVLHPSEPDLRSQQILPPDVISLARYVHVYTNEARYDAQVLHFPVFRDRPWLNKKIDVALATKYLESMLKVASSNPQFPVMGKHCGSCSTKPCLKVFNNG